MLYLTHVKSNIINDQDALEAPTFIVNLDEDPNTRWTHVIQPFQNDFVPIMQWVDSLIPSWLQSILVPFLAKIDQSLPGEYGAELRGVAAGANITLGKIVALNLIYDFTAYCTSIVAQRSNGTIYHARNLDYDIPGLRNITIQVHFQQGGVTQYKCTTFAGYVGCLTGVRPSAFSLTIDERDVPGQSILDNILAVFHGGHSLGFLLRDTLATSTDFSSALSVLSQDYLLAPCYIIMAGVNAGEGAVITRDRNQTRDLWMIDTTTTDRWWLVETNYDHWEPPPPNDDRRDPANKAMAAVGPDAVNTTAMYQVLSIPPVLNSATQYTSMLVPEWGYMNTYIRWDAPSHVSTQSSVRSKRFFTQLSKEQFSFDF